MNLLKMEHTQIIDIFQQDLIYKFLPSQTDLFSWTSIQTSQRLHRDFTIPVFSWLCLFNEHKQSVTSFTTIQKRPFSLYLR